MVLPDLAECVWLYPEETLFTEQLALLKQAADSVKEVSVVDRVLFLAIILEQVIPNVPAERPLVV